MEYIAVFKSRNQTMRFSEILTENGIFNRIINTPKEAGLGCGISVLINSSDFGKACNLHSQSDWSAWAGWLRK